MTKMAKPATAATTRAKRRKAPARKVAARKAAPKARKATPPRARRTRAVPRGTEVKAASRIFDFGAGPATMPVEVLERAKWELVNWHEAGMSVMEMSHRGKEFVAIAA